MIDDGPCLPGYFRAAIMAEIIRIAWQPGVTILGSRRRRSSRFP
jgi:hypothetical protein